jgi:hypothetical protein
MRSATATMKRCSWITVDDPLMLQYHDREWGVPIHNDGKHFEFLVLDLLSITTPSIVRIPARTGTRFPQQTCSYEEDGEAMILLNTRLFTAQCSN